MAWKRSRVRISPGPPKQSPTEHRLTRMPAPFHIAEEVTRSPFGVQTGRNLDSSAIWSDSSGLDHAKGANTNSHCRHESLPAPCRRPLIDAHIIEPPRVWTACPAHAVRVRLGERSTRPTRIHQCLPPLVDPFWSADRSLRWRHPECLPRCPVVVKTRPQTPSHARCGSRRPGDQSLSAGDVQTNAETVHRA
jgi:hypothetical protein